MAEILHLNYKDQLEILEKNSIFEDDFDQLVLSVFDNFNQADLFVTISIDGDIFMDIVTNFVLKENKKGALAIKFY